jgi:hypothetical protein
MHFGWDPDLQRQFDFIRQSLRRTHQTPTREWPLVHVAEHDALLVVREWPDGELTAYAVDYTDLIRRS